MRTVKFQKLRDQLRDNSKFLLTSKRLTQFALGKDAASEHGTNLHKLAEIYQGDMGLMCTNLESNKAVSLLESFKEEDFARMGETATMDFSLAAGPLIGPNGKFQHTLEPTLRDYGLPTKLNRGEIELLRDCEVCSEGDVLTVNQANLLTLFDIKMSSFTLTPVALFENGKAILSTSVKVNEDPVAD
eukprot:g1895.t1